MHGCGSRGIVCGVANECVGVKYHGKLNQAEKHEKKGDRTEHELDHPLAALPGVQFKSYNMPIVQWPISEALVSVRETQIA